MNKTDFNGHKGCNCGEENVPTNTPSVIQINNHEAPVLFHRVDMPASMGDSEENPPVQGAYRNILLHYDADDQAFLYNSDGIFTRLTFTSGGGVVKSVNEKTGDVILKTADLENNSDYQTGTEVSNAIATHNESNTSHDDIRQALNAKADQANVDNIAALIPSQATASNQLADKAFVNNVVGNIETLLNNLISGGGAE